MTEGKPQTTQETIKGFFKVAVGVWNIAPSEFWQMTPTEWWWIYEMKMELADRPISAQSIKDELADNEAFALEHGETYRTLKDGRQPRSNTPPPRP